MKHKASQDLFAYWNRLRGLRMAPERSDVDPGAIRGALGDTLMLATETQRSATIRLAGTRICALFGRELKNETFQALWDNGSRRDIDMLIAQTADEGTGFVAGAIAHVADGDPVALELLLLPLFHRGTTDGRLIGTLAPLQRPDWLGSQPVQSLTLGSRRHVGPQVDGRLVPRFVEVPAEFDEPALVVLAGGRR